MTGPAKEIVNAMTKLPESERLKIVEELLASLEPAATDDAIFLEKVLQGTSIGTPLSGRATLKDVYSCYRELLLREPDDAGLESYHREIAKGMDLATLVRSFVNSREYSTSGLGSRGDSRTHDVNKMLD